MLTSLHLKNFTVFPDAKLEFGKNLNLIIGENGLGKTILQISQSGIQVFIATHSLFLMRELYIMQARDFTGFDTRYFGLHTDDEAVVITQANNLDEIGSITTLDEELLQSERYMDTEIGVPYTPAPATDEE